VSSIPAWSAASAGHPAQAGQVNQLLAPHNAVFTYTGAPPVTQQATGTGVYSGSQSLWLSQKVTTGPVQTAVGAVSLQLSAVGGSPVRDSIAAVTVGLYADAGGQPAGAALASVALTCPYVYGAPFWVPCPLGVAVTANTSYHLVTNLVGTAGHYYAWQHSNAGTGAAESPDGAAWTNQPYGLMHQVYDQSASGLLQSVSEDGGTRLTTFTYDAQNRISGVAQYTAAQGGGSIVSTGTLTYANGLLTGVS
jgi:hypothetical protein